MKTILITGSTDGIGKLAAIKLANASGKYFDNDQGDPKGAFGDAHADAYDAAKISALIEKTGAILA